MSRVNFVGTKAIDGVFSNEEAPSGGYLGEYCKNSALFTDRVCKTDGKDYQDGQLCPCFQDPPTNKATKGKSEESK